MTKSIARVVGASIIAAMLAGCSGAAPPPPVNGLRLDLSRLGVSPRALAALGPVEPATTSPPTTQGTKDLYVNDLGYNAVEILTNDRWKIVGSITKAIDEPDANWVDSKGNLYVTDPAGDPNNGPAVTEYDKNGALVYRYNYNSYYPVGVTTDLHENVYIVDLGSGINEFAQRTNSPLFYCYPGFVEGVAVDKKGDVFVDFNATSHGEGGIVEYRGGLAGCTATALSVKLSFAGGMALDDKNDLVVCDQDARTVDVIAPPYTAVSRMLGSGYSDPLHVSINQTNDRAYVADVGAWNVRVLSYPTGSKIATLDYKQGLSLPTSAVDRKNYVP
ncbi:MAG: hypothetical protein JO078_03920 [Candidatus Eremiobacteraeota bacterium]|nr:hypothetical protein [Candidatus Eremiobacteraeota bacterium]